MSKLYVVTGIQWEVDEMEDLERLPSVAYISSDNLHLRNGEDADDKELVAERVSDYLSDHYGFCHKGFDIEEKDMERRWVNCDLPRESAGRFKEYLRDNGLWKRELCEPSENGSCIHFECKLTEAEIASAEAFINKL